MPRSISSRALLVAALSICASAQVSSSFNSTNINNSRRNDTDSTTTSTIFSTSTEFVTTSAPNSTASSANATSLPATGTGSAYASSCNAAKVRWVREGGHEVISTSTFTTTTRDASAAYSYAIETSTSLAPGATPYTLCDAYPRLNGTTSVSVSTGGSVSFSIGTITTTTEIYRNISAPTCTIASNDCAALNATYNAYTSWRIASADASYSSRPFTTPAPPSPSPYHSPICGAATLSSPFTTLIPPACRVNTAHVQLYYWPVTTAANCSLCGTGACATQTMGPTISGQPNTIVTLDTTLTSPTVYIAFSGSYIYQSNSETISDSRILVFPQTAASVSSLRGLIGGGFEAQAYPFNYADLNLPVPAAAYRGQPKCFTYPNAFGTVTKTYTAPGGSVVTATSVSPAYYASSNLCSTIWNDYNPALSIPAELSSLSIAEASGAQCNFTVMKNGVLFDPPVALTQAAAVVVPTAPGGSGDAQPTNADPTTSAQPGDTAGPTTPRPTAQPDSPRTTAVPAQSPKGQGNGDHPQSPAALPMPQGRPNNAPTNQGQGPDPGQQQQQPSSPSVGNIIASVIGATPQGNSPAPAPNDNQPPNNAPAASPTNAIEALTAAPNAPVAPAGGDDRNGVADPGNGPPNGAVIAGANNQQATVINDLSNGGVVVGGSTILPGQSVSVQGLGNVVAQTGGVIVNGQSQAFSALAAPTPADGDGAVLQGSGNQAVTVLQQPGGGGNAIIGSATVPLGATTRIAGIGNVVAQSSGVVVNGVSTIPFSGLQPGSTNAAVITVGGQSITAAPDGVFIIAPGQTLTPGGQVTVIGTTLSLESGGGFVVVNGVTQSVPHGMSTASPSGTTPASGSARRGGTTPSSGGNGASATQTAGAALQRELSASLAMVAALLAGFVIL